MSDALPLQTGETVVFDHVPSLRSFKRTALVMLAATLPVVVVFLYVFPDTFWPAVPLFITCFILMQERFRLGRYRAWITNQRVIFQGGQSISLGDIDGVDARTNGVRITRADGAKGSKLFYPADGAALVNAITSARKAAI